MSAFEGTPLDIAFRDCGIDAFAIVGIAMEIGIEPTVRHGSDLGYVPVLVVDACGSAARRTSHLIRQFQSRGPREQNLGTHSAPLQCENSNHHRSHKIQLRGNAPHPQDR
jgi:hypothetical protein